MHASLPSRGQQRCTACLPCTSVRSLCRSRSVRILYAAPSLSRSFSSCTGRDRRSFLHHDDTALVSGGASPQQSGRNNTRQLARRLQQSPWGGADEHREDFARDSVDNVDRALPAPSSSSSSLRRPHDRVSHRLPAWQSAQYRGSPPPLSGPKHAPQQPRLHCEEENEVPLSFEASPTLQPQRAPPRTRPRQPRQPRPSTTTITKEALATAVGERQNSKTAATPSAAAAAAAATEVSSLVAEALAFSIGQAAVDLEDDDIVLDTPAALLPCVSAAASEELQAAHKRYQHTTTEVAGANEEARVVTPEQSGFAHPAARGVGQDVIDLVTDAFATQREAEVRRRREVLYELTHPNPIDYTYNGKLVPPPPLSFGQVTEEARSLGNKMMLGQTYSLVRQAGARASEDDLCGSIYNSGSAAQGAATTTVSPASTIETAISGPSSAFATPRRTPYRSRAREDNIFRDHNYFFEVNELYQEIVLVGRACAGKSSLLNSLLGQNVAKTSSSPNTTRKISFYQSVTPEELHAFHAREHHNQLVKLPGGGLQLTFVDMPGYGIEGMSDQWRDAAIELTDAYFGVRRSVNTVLYCMDCERGLTKTDIKYFEWLENVQGTFFVVLTKCDSVPHSRVTSVMRQVYTLITKNRRKYRKVFPFIIPTSAKDGTNMELLRGLITETSGMIPGDKLRDLLKQKKEAFTHAALLEESSRVDAVRQLERAQAREFFQLTRGISHNDGAASQKTGAAAAAAKTATQAMLNETPNAAHLTQPLLAAPQGNNGPQRYVLHLDGKRTNNTGGETEEEQNAHDDTGYRADVVASLLGHSGTGATSHASSAFPTAASAAAAAAQARRERRERFLAWRRAHPLATAVPTYADETSAEDLKDGAAADTEISVQDGSPSHHRFAGLSSAAEEGAAPSQPQKQSQHASTTGAGGQVPRSGRFRLHTGLDSPQAAHTVLEVPGDADGMDILEERAEATQHHAHAGSSDATYGKGSERSEENAGPAPAPPTPPSARSSVIGFTPGLSSAAPTTTPSPLPANPLQGYSGSSSSSTGAVSRFLNVLEEYSQQPNIIKSAKQRRKEARWQKGKQKGVGARGGKGGSSGGGLLAEDASGRLSSYKAGKPCGPAVVTPDTAIDRRQAEWRAAQLKTLLMRENPTAPWQAMQQLRRKVQSRQEEAALSGMRKKEAAAYLRDAGRVTESFDKFEGEVTAAKYMNEVRQAPTLRSQQQMHLNATAKINYRSMPPGLWKRYGEKDTYWPTPHVLGRAQDESHKP